MDARTLDMLVDEIRPRVEGARVAAATAPTPRCLALELEAGAGPEAGRRATLAATTAKWLPLVCLTEEPLPPSPGRRVADKPAARHADAVSALKGGTVVSVERARAARRVEIVVERTDPFGRTARRVLAIDIGARPGFLVADAPAARAAGGPVPESRRWDGERPDFRAGAAVSWWRDAAGRLHVRIGATPHPRATGSRRFDSANAAAEFALREFRAPLALEHRRDALDRAIRAKIRRKERAVEKVRAELDDAGRAEDYRRGAHLLLTRKDQVPRGRRSVTLTDFDGATPVEIPLDPRLDAAANAELLFRRARKSERRAARTPARLREIEAELEDLRRAASSVTDATGDHLETLERRHLPPSDRRSRRDREERAPRFRRYVVADGWEVLVGRSNRDNDLLTHRTAGPDDIWFHARQAPGSHVILRRAGRASEPSPEAIREAAAIAAYHSKAGRSSKVAVCYTEKRYVRKPRGARPGLAAVTREKVIMVEPAIPRS